MKIRSVFQLIWIKLHDLIFCLVLYLCFCHYQQCMLSTISKLLFILFLKAKTQMNANLNKQQLQGSNSIEHIKKLSESMWNNRFFHLQVVRLFTTNLKKQICAEHEGAGVLCHTVQCHLSIKKPITRIQRGFAIIEYIYIYIYFRTSGACGTSADHASNMKITFGERCAISFTPQRWQSLKTVLKRHDLPRRKLSLV